MHCLTVEIARSISEERARELLTPAFKSLPPGSWSFKLWRNPVWNAPFNDRHGPQYERMSVTCSESRVRLLVKKEERLRTEFPTLSPDFARRYSGSKLRWANIVNPSSYIYSNYEIATVLPHNTFDRSWPRLGLGTEVNICREGWVFLQDHKDWEQPVYLLKNDEALRQWFERHGIKAELSEPGRIAKQILNSLEGFWGLCLIRNPDTLQSINKLAKRRAPAAREHWDEILGKHLASNSFPNLTLEDYAKRNVIRVGIETKCSYCGHKNWHNISSAGYVNDCECCLKRYDFPQTELQPKNGNWKYRVIGPFAVPNYAEGSYGALLTIKALSNVPTKEQAINFSTAMKLESNGQGCEVDFVIWSANEANYDTYGNPQLIIGEAKSFGENLTEKDIEKLKLAAKFLPDSILVISVLKDHFSDDEKKLLKEFVEWARTSDNYRPRHWVILLTGTELFARFDISNAWKNKGEPYSKFTNYQDTLNELSDATQAIYLEMPSYYSWLEKKREAFLINNINYETELVSLSQQRGSPHKIVIDL